MDFNGTLTEEDVRRVELLANQAVLARSAGGGSSCPTARRWQTSNTAAKRRRRGWRIVRIEGVDTCACCGTP